MSLRRSTIWWHTIWPTLALKSPRIVFIRRQVQWCISSRAVPFTLSYLSMLLPFSCYLSHLRFFLSDPRLCYINLICVCILLTKRWTDFLPVNSVRLLVSVRNLLVQKCLLVVNSNLSSKRFFFFFITKFTR